MAEERKYSEKTIERYNRMVDSFQNLDPKGITVLTGTNGSGKSLIRKQLPFAVKDWYDLKDVSETQGMIKSTSMDARTGSNPEWGGLSGIMRDTEWVATSQNTYYALKGVFNAITDKRTKYLVIDEFEIGCSEETVLAFVKYINKELKKALKKNLEGAIIITHSRLAVKNLKFDYFVNLDGLTKDEWLNREVVPTDLKELEENELFFYIRDHKK